VETPAVTEAPAEPPATPAVTPKVQTREEVVREPEDKKPAEPSRPGRGRMIAGIVLSVTGVIVAAGGGAMALLAMNESNRQEEAARTGGVFLPDAESNGKQYTMLSYVGYGAGGALLVTGLIIAATAPRASDKPAAATASARPSTRPIVAPLVGRDFAGASLGLQF
jgi:ABC-type Na+ efflux pump permease subunit